MAQVCLLYLIDINPVITDLAVVNVVKAVNEVCNCSFARAGRSNESHLLARFCIQGNIVQHSLFRRVSKIDIVKAHVALQSGIGRGPIVVPVFPRPDVGAFLTLAHAAVGIFLGIYQCDIALVSLRLFIQQSKNTVCTRKAHNDHIHLVRHLADRACKLFGHIQEWDDDTDAERHSGDTDVRYISQ